MRTSIIGRITEKKKTPPISAVVAAVTIKNHMMCEFLFFIFLSMLWMVDDAVNVGARLARLRQRL